jgi:SAM-dependent methyltransferase
MSESTDIANEARARSRAVWAAGNWDEVSKILPAAGERVLDIAGVQSGMDVVDVGCGSGGTVAIPAAVRGARVVGVDVAPEHFEAAMRRAAEAGVEVDWMEGDAAALPVADASFDRVLSTFGHAFAPDQEGAARELVRVCLPGGMIVAAMWTPEGVNGQIFGIMGKHMPPPPPGFQPPVRWGTEERWHELLDPLGVELEFRREMLVVERNSSAEDFQTEFEANFGPAVMARKALGDDGFQAVHDELVALVERNNTAQSGGIHFEAEYLVAIGRVPE